MKLRIVTALFFLMASLPSFSDITFPSRSHTNYWGVWPFNYDRTETITIRVVGAVYQSSPNTAWFRDTAVLVFYASVSGDDTDSGRMLEYIGPTNVHTSYGDIYSHTLNGSSSVLVDFQDQDGWTGAWFTNASVGYYLSLDSTPPSVAPVSMTYEWHGAPVEVVFAAQQPDGPGVNPATSSFSVKRLAGSYVNGGPTPDTPVSVSLRNGVPYFLAPSAGVYSITATDRCGLVSVPAIVYVNDVTGPSLTVSGAPPSGTAQSVTVTATATEIEGDTGLASFSITEYRRSQINGTLTETTMPIPRPYSATFPDTGQYQLRYTATDHASSISGPDNPVLDRTSTYPADGTPIQFKVLAVAPHIALPETDTNGWYNNPDGIFIQFKDDYGDALAGLWQEPGVSSEWHPLDIGVFLRLGDDSHLINLSTTDAAGQTTTLSRTLKVETENPSLSISYKYGGVPVPLQENGTTYLHGQVDLVAIRNAISGFDSDVSYTVESSSGELANFVPLEGTYLYVFSVTDVAGNSRDVEYVISYSSSATALPLSEPDYPSPYLYATGRIGSVGTTAIASDSVYFDIPKSIFLREPNYYAPPNSVTVSLDGGLSQPHTFVDDSAGSYSGAASPIDITSLGDGQHTLNYSFLDQSGATSSGSIDFVLHRTPPSAVSSPAIARTSEAVTGTGGAVWAADGLGGWQIAQADVQKVAGSNGNDGIQVNDYIDAQGDFQVFPPSGYHLQISDALNPSSLISRGVKEPYYFTWGAESSRTLTLSVVSEAGVPSEPTTVTLLKPAWGGLNAPVKVVGSGSFAVQWADDGVAIPNGTKQVFYGSASDPDSWSSSASEAQGAVTVSGLAVGSTIHYRQRVTLAAAGTPSTEVPSVTVLGDGSSGPTVGSFFINYENIAAYPLPSSVAYITSAGSLELPDLPAQAADGQSIQYALAIGLDSSGTIANPTYVGANLGTGSFEYDLLSVFGQSDVHSLRAYLQGKTVDLRIDAWYGSPITPGGTPTISANAPAVSTGVVRQVLQDFDAPTVALSGMMGSANQITSSRMVSGTASDVGGSHLMKVQASWAPVEGGVVPDAGEYTQVPPQDLVGVDSGSFSISLVDAGGNPLPDGWYAIQVVVTDSAGNAWDNGGTAVKKVIDSTPASLVSASLQTTVNGTEPGTGALLTNADGSITISVQTNENSGSGLGSIQYRWTDRADQPLGQGWVAAAIRPSAVFSQQLVSAETHVATLRAAPAGVGKLHLKLVDLAGNVGPDTSNASWLVSYDPNPPLVDGIAVAGLVQTGGSYFVRSPAGLQVSYSPGTAVSNADVQWGVSSGAAATAWGGWGAGIGSLISLISLDGASYQVQFMARNANGQSTGVLSSPVFMKDALGPTNVSAALSGGSSFVAGQPIPVTVSAVASSSGLSWTWSYLDATDPNATPQSAAYGAGDFVVITRPGIFDVVFTATSGSGVAVSSSALRVTVASTGLVVRDFQKYSDGQGVAGAAWNFVGESAASYQYRWFTSQGRVLQNWQAGDATQSATITLADATGSQPLATGDVVRLQVQALDGQGQVLGDAASAGSLVDLTGPVFGADSGPASPSGMAAPLHVTPGDVWAQFEGRDLDSGILGAGVFVKKLVIAADGSDGWQAVSSLNLACDGGLERIDLDLSGKVTSGDRIVIEVSLINGAGLSAMRASPIVGVDASPPPQPVVMDMADAVNPSQPLTFSWTFTPPDPQSGTVQYYWKAYADANDLADSAWTAVPAGQTSVGGLDFSVNGYANSPTYATAAYEDGTVLHFAVMAVNGAGLSSVGYSQGIILDRTAPRVQAVAVTDANNNAINQYVALANLVGSDGQHRVNVAVDVSSLSGVAGISIEAGRWVSGTGFVADAASVVDFTPTPEQVLTQTSYSLPVALSQPLEGAILMLRGYVVNAAGNVAQVLYSAGFKVEGPSPVLTKIQGTLSPDQVSFTWQVDRNSDFIRGYQVSLMRLAAGQPASPVAIPDANGNPQAVLFTTHDSWSGDLGALGFARGDQVQLSVTLLTQLGQSNTLTRTLSYIPDAPRIPPGGFLYTNFFSTHLNIKSLQYQAGTPNVGVQQVQWRVLDTQTGQMLQDWTADYGANNSPVVSYTSESAPFDSFSRSPVDGQKILVQVKAQSLVGVWSSVTPSTSILVDTTEAAGTLTRPSAANPPVQSPYSNGQGGQINGWNLTAVDGQSGILAYELALVAQSVANGAGFDPASIWSAASPKPASTGPGQTLSLQNLGIAGVNVSTPEPTDYYAYLRVQNGTEDWSPALRSLLVTVDQIRPVIRLVYPAGPNGVFVTDHQGSPMTVKVTNAATQPVSVVSSKESTTFEISVNGVALGNQPASVNGGLGGDTTVLSYATADLSGVGTLAVSVTATDLFGNQATVSDQLRFNQAPTVAVLRQTTTSAQVLNLEQLVNVYDSDEDYPLTYQWSLGGGIGVNYVAGTPYAGGPTATWASSAYHTAKFLQQGASQNTTYPLTLTVIDAWGKTQVSSLAMSVRPTTAGPLYANEYWTGAVALTGTVEVPAGLVLTADGAAVTVNGSLDTGSPQIMQGGLVVRAGGSFTVANTSGTTSFASGTAGYYWKGIEVAGALQGTGIEVNEAERGLVLLPGGSISASSINLNNNLIGLHLLGGSLYLNGGRISGDREYGIKEDEAGSYSVMNMEFADNGVSYYQRERAAISITELNAISGNGGNR